MANDSVFNPKKCNIPDVPPIDPIPDLEDCDVPVAPDVIVDCPSPTIPLPGIQGPAGNPGISIPGADGTPGAPGLDGLDGQDGFIGQDGVALNLPGCCFWTWCVCFGEAPQEPVDLNCPKEDTCLPSPGHWVLNEEISDADCASTLPPCSIGDFFGQTEIDCPCPEPEPSISESISETISVIPPTPLLSCLQCCESGTLFEQLAVIIPAGWTNNRCDGCTDINGTFILDKFVGAMALNPVGSVFPTNCTGLVCAQWRFESESIICTQGSGAGCPSEGTTVSLVIEATLSCLAFNDTCTWTVRVIPQFSSGECTPGFCNYQLIHARDARDCSASQVLPRISSALNTEVCATCSTQVSVSGP